MSDEFDELLYDSQLFSDGFESNYDDVQFLDIELMDESEGANSMATTAKKRLFELDQSDANRASNLTSKKTKKKTVNSSRLVVPKDATRFEKRLLAGLVEKEPAIWDLNHELHSNIQAVTSAWERIQKEVPHRSVLECKGIWKSLRDGSRYRVKRKGKSGDSADEEEEQPQPEWEFSDCMSFIMPMSSKYPRKTTTIGLDESTSLTETETEASESNYSYATSGRGKDAIVQSVNTISKSITDFISSRNEAKQHQVQPDHRTLKFDYIWFNLDKLFEQMSLEEVNRLNLEYMKLAFAVIENKNQTEI